MAIVRTLIHAIMSIQYIDHSHNDVKYGFELHEIGLALEKCRANHI